MLDGRWCLIALLPIFFFFFKTDSIYSFAQRPIQITPNHASLRSPNAHSKLPSKSYNTPLLGRPKSYIYHPILSHLTQGSSAAASPVNQSTYSSPNPETRIPSTPPSLSKNYASYTYDGGTHLNPRCASYYMQLESTMYAWI